MNYCNYPLCNRFCSRADPNQHNTDIHVSIRPKFEVSVGIHYLMPYNVALKPNILQMAASRGANRVVTAQDVSGFYSVWGNPANNRRETGNFPFLFFGKYRLANADME